MFIVNDGIHVPIITQGRRGCKLGLTNVIERIEMQGYLIFLFQKILELASRTRLQILTSFPNRWIGGLFSIVGCEDSM